MYADVAPLDIGAVRYSTVADHSGRRYVDFRRTLTPRWGMVWASLLAGHLALVLSAGGIILVERAGVGGILGPVTLALVGGAVLGFFLHYVMMFLHEGAHYNLAPGRGASDALTNAFVGIFVGMDVKAYRKVHFEHHRHLGTPQDPERSYFLPLNLRFLVESLTGIRLVRALREYRSLMKSKSRAENAGGRVERDIVFLVSAVVNGAIVGCALWSGARCLAAAWVLGQIVFLTFFNTVRQVLEHRSEFADDGADYRRVPHGPVNRLFGEGPFARTFGAAGFNRHLLHHWDPSVSFTRLRDVERFIMHTDIAPLMLSRKTTYYRAWRQLERI